MTYSDLQRMDPDEYERRLDDYLFEIIDDPTRDFSLFRQIDGHADMHFCQRESELFARLTHQPISAASCFAEPEEAKDFIANAMSYKLKDISGWFFKQQREFNDENDFRRLSITLDMAGIHPIGYGMDRQLNLFDTRAITIVLDRDFQPDSAFGFSLITAYPDITILQQSRTWLRQERVEDLIMRDGYCKDNMDRLYCYYHLTEPDMHISYYEHDGEPSVRLSYLAREHRIDVFLKENKEPEYRNRIGVSSKKIEWQQIVFGYPDISHAIMKVRNTLDQIQKGTIDISRYHDQDHDQCR